MSGIGHFPVAENYPLCKQYLWPALLDITESRAARILATGSSDR